MTEDEFVNEYMNTEAAQLLSDEELRRLYELPKEEQYNLPDDLRHKFQATKKFNRIKGDTWDSLDGFLVGDMTVEDVLKEIRGSK